MELRSFGQDEQKKKLYIARKIITEMVDNYYPESMREDIEIKTESKKEIDNNLKGYAFYQLVVDETVCDDSLQSIIDNVQQEKMKIALSGLIPKLVYGEYIANDPKEREEAKTKLMAIRFVLELNDGDYDRLSNVLSDAEEEGMRTQPSASELTIREREEEAKETRQNGGIRPRHLM